MNRRYLLFVFILVLLAAGLLFVWFGLLKRTTGDVEPPAADEPRSERPPRTGTPDASPGRAGSALARAAGTTPPPLALARDFPSGSGLHDALLDAESRLNEGAHGRDALAIIRELRAQLLAADPAEAAAAIHDYLASDRNASTGLPFVVGEGGRLNSLPDLRSVLIDLLAEIDPAESLRQAELVFDAKTSPDEYALSLRNLARLGPQDADATAYLARRTRELLNHEPWAGKPVAAYVEAFDAVVHARDMAALPTLSRFAAPEGGQALNHPAFMTLDRLVIVDPLETLDELASNPGLLQDRPMMRAGFFARADPDDPAQVGLARDYLLSQGPSSETAAYFLGLFPNVNEFLSHNLITPSGYLGHDEVVRRLEGALDVIATWEDDPAFSAYQDQLHDAATRINEQLGR